MTKTQEVAKILDKSEYRGSFEELIREIEPTLKESNLVVVVGASDDLVEIYGSVRDEFGAYNGKDFSVMARNGNHHLKARRILFNAKVKSIWCGKIDDEKMEDWSGDYSWKITSEIEHQAFKVMEDDEVFCYGIVFDATNLTGFGTYH